MNKYLTLLLLLIIGISAQADVLVFGANVNEGFVILDDQVWAHLQDPESRFKDCNSTLINHPDLGLVLVDPPSRPDALKRLLLGLPGLTDRPVRWIILTHFHGDHTQGSAAILQAFPEATIVGHESLRQDISERAAKDHFQRVTRLEKVIPEAEAQLATGKTEDGTVFTAEQMEQEKAAIQRAKVWLEANREARFLLPDLTYEKKLVLGSKEFPIELFHFRGHSEGDTVVWLPNQKILAAGDLIDAMPFAGHGFPRAWQQTLETLSTWPVEKTIPGHGPVFDGHQQTILLADWFKAVVKHGNQAQQQNQTMETLVASENWKPWRKKLAGENPAAQRFFDGTLKDTLEAVWRELDHAEPDGP